MNDKKQHIKKLAEMVFDGEPLQMKYLRKCISELSEEDMLAFVQEVDRIFQQYAENI